jgi:four helix bundle protein
MDFVADLYTELENFPAHEKFGLTSQLQRAAVSIPSNIAEGAARKNTRELLQFLHVARGSISELDTQLELCLRIGHLKSTNYEKLTTRLNEIGKMLNGLIASLARKL